MLKSDMTLTIFLIFFDSAADRDSHCATSYVLFIGYGQTVPQPLGATQC